MKTIKAFFAPIAFAFMTIRKRAFGYIIMAGAIAFIDAVLPFANVFLVRMIVDAITTTANAEQAIQYAVLLFVCNVVLRTARNLFQWRKDINYGKAMDSICTANAQKFMNVDFECLASTEYLNNTRNILMTEFIGVSTIEFVCTILGACLALLGNIVILSSLAPWIILIFLFFILLSAQVQKCAMKQNKIYDMESAPIKRLVEYLRKTTLGTAAVKEIKVLGLKPFFLKQIDNANIQALSFETKKQKTTMRAGALDVVLQTLQTGGLYAYLAYAFIHQSIAISDFTLYLGMATNFTQNVSLLMRSITGITLQNEWLEYYCHYHELPELIRSSALRPIQPIPQNASIEFRDVYFRYPGAPDNLLEGISFFVPAGSALSIVGLNGAGKTTIIKLLCRLYDPDCGSIYVNGENIRNIPYDEYTQYISTMFQDFRLFGITIRDNLDCHRLKSDMEVCDALEKSDILRKVKLLPEGIGAHLYKGYGWDGYEFSQGEQQKLAIARAFIKRSPVVVLDEPTAAVDPVAEYKIFRSFYELTKGKTSLFISHRLSSTKYSDLVLVVDEGRIVECGSHDELMRNGGEYARMYTMQMENYRV